MSNVDPAESDLDDHGGGDYPTPRHGIGPATVVMAPSSAGFRGLIKAVCLRGMVEVARDPGVAWMVEQVIDDPGLSIAPNRKWWFCKAQVIPADDPQIREAVRRAQPPEASGGAAQAGA